MKMKKFIILLLIVSMFTIKEVSFASLEKSTVTINIVDAPIQLETNSSQVVGLASIGSEFSVVDSTDLFYKVEKDGEVLGWILKAYTKEGAAAAIDSYKKYKQRGESWSSIPYSQGNIGTSGCGPTSAAICASGLGCNLNPGELVQAKYKNKHLDAGTYSNRLLLKSVGYNLSENVGSQKALQYLASGQPIICHAGPGFYTSYGHFMALIGARGNEVYLSDPYSYREDKNGWIDMETLINRGVDAFYVVKVL